MYDSDGEIINFDSGKQILLHIQNLPSVIYLLLNNSSLVCYFSIHCNIIGMWSSSPVISSYNSQVGRFVDITHADYIRAGACDGICPLYVILCSGIALGE